MIENYSNPGPFGRVLITFLDLRKIRQFKQPRRPVRRQSFHL